MQAQSRKTKYLPIYLPGDVYVRLEQLAMAEERDPVQHARWLIRRYVSSATADGCTPATSSDAGDSAVIRELVPA
jgi:hypothetical protein